MRKIVYYVAVSLDGFISGPEGDISGFVPEGTGVDRYRKDLEAFDTVIMGRNTYEFGYQFGLKPGQPAYPNMMHYIFSNSLTFSETHDNVQVLPPNMDLINKLKNESGSDIYLCGGGIFAGWMLDNGLIDLLKLKLNPVILGDGIPLFGSSKWKQKLVWIDTESFEDGIQLITYALD